MTAAVFSFTYPLKSAMMVFSDYQKQRILYYRCLGKSHAEIARRLTEEGRRATKVGILKRTHRHSVLLSEECRSSRFLYTAARSPASSCVALLASRRLILCTKKMKCFKDDNNEQEILISHQNVAPSEASLSKKSF